MRRRRLGLRTAALALLAGAAFVPAAPAQESGLVELRLTAAPAAATVEILVDSTGRPLLPVLATLRYLEIPTVAAGDSLVLEWPPGSWRSTLHLADGRLRTADSLHLPPPGDWHRREDEAFAAEETLERILGGELEFDWAALSVLVAGRRDYPLVRRLQNEAGRAGRVGASPFPRDEPAVPYPARTGGMVAGWGVAGTLRGGSGGDGTARAALGMGLLGGALEGGGALSLRGEQLRRADGFVRYERAFPRARLVRQLRLGELLSDGLVSRSLLGVALSNDALYTPQYFGDAQIRPVLPAGWEYEVYQGEFLVGVSPPGADGGVAAPLGYGSTPVRVRMIGPAGQERVEELTFLVPPVQVPPGAWRYFAGAGRCREAACRGLAYGDLRHGLSTALTAGLGLEYALRDSAPAALRPYGLASLVPGAGLRAEIRARAGSLVHGSLERPGAARSWQLSGGWRADEVRAAAPAIWYADGSARWLLPWLNGSVPVGTGALLRGSGRGAPPGWRASVVLPTGRVNVTTAFESGLQPRDVLSVRANTLLARRLSRSVRDVNVYGQVDFFSDGAGGLDMGASFRVLPALSVVAALSWERGRGAPGVSLAVLSRGRQAYVQANGYRDAHGSALYASASGGASYGHAAGLLWTPDETLGRGGFAGRVFLDDDADGVWDPGEAPAADVPVIVDGGRAVTDSAGWYHAWGSLPYRVSTLAVDTLNTPTTDLAPREPEYQVRPSPNQYTRLDLPVVRTREAAGRVAWRGRAGPLGGISVELRRAGDDRARRAQTFSDGEFYLSRIPPGRYTVAVARSSLEALRAAAEADPAVVEVAGGTDAPVALPTLWLTRPDEPAPSPMEPVDSAAAPSQPAGEPAARPAPLRARVHFAFDRARLTGSESALLDSIADRMRGDPRMRLRLVGHTDARGPARYNQGLSLRRARAVASYLVRRGVAADRLELAGRGEGSPLASNADARGRRLNRRTEIEAVFPPP